LLCRHAILLVQPPGNRPCRYRFSNLLAVDDGARIIGLIDGVFFDESAVAHKEILYAIKKRVRVVGASSMGALRSAELDVLGMEGVGEIYQLYKDGVLVSDDEVALIFDPDTASPTMRLFGLSPRVMVPLPLM
jgi:hypothetical protein